MYVMGTHVQGLYAREKREPRVERTRMEPMRERQHAREPQRC